MKTSTKNKINRAENMLKSCVEKTPRVIKKIASDNPNTSQIVAGGTIGAVSGGVATSLAGLTAIGVVGKGVGIGAAAGPVGAIVGGLVGVAAVSVIKAVKSDRK